MDDMIAYLANHGTFKFSCKHEFTGYHDPWQMNVHAFKCVLTFDGKRYTVPFYQGLGITEQPTANDVLDCLVSDAESAHSMSEDEFIREFDSDHKTYLACERTRRNLVRLFGEDILEVLMYGEEEGV